MSSHPLGRRGLALAAVGSALAVTVAGIALPGAPASAVTDVTTANGASFSIHDARRPSLDTGSIRSLSQSRLEGFGNLFLRVDGSDARMNGQMLRGFGLRADGRGGFDSTRSVELGGVQVARDVEVEKADDVVSFFDTFTNTTTAPLTVEVSFGGSLGWGTGANQGTVRATSDGDADVEPADTWVTSDPDADNLRPVGIVLGEGVDAVGDQQAGPFTTAYDPTTSAANYPGFVHRLEIAPGETRSLLQYVVAGASGAGTREALTSATAALATTPDTERLSLDQLCTVANWELDLDCGGAAPLSLPSAPVEETVTTTVDYDVTGATIERLQADMRAGTVTSEEITQAYLDRITAYDDGVWGFKSFLTVAKDALAQARAADRRRAAGDDSDLLGIPLGIKDLYDTVDMPTTGGTRALEGWQPDSDAWQVAKLREAGAVIIGKTNLSEFANSGSFSESGFQQTWNALYPSKTSFGSSGGSASALAADLAAGAMGTQTGVSLYAPSTGAGLATFRGTDGLSSTAGVMPLTWAQDHAGPIAKTVTDLAYLLNATSSRTTGNNPDDLLTARVDNDLRPADFTEALDPDALEGVRLGVIPTSFRSTSIADDPTGPAVRAELEKLAAESGATLVEMPEPGSYTRSPGGNLGIEGWERYIADQPDFPYPTGNELLCSPQVLPYNQRTSCDADPMTDEQVEAYLAWRDGYKAHIAAWMDEHDVDAVVYPGFISAVGNNDASSAVLSSDRATGVLTSNVGLPTVVVPVGAGPQGYSMSVQVVGRAWSDADVLGMGYALEQHVDDHVTSAYAPALPVQEAEPTTTTTRVSVSSPRLAYGHAARATVVVTGRGATPTGTVAVDVAGRRTTVRLAGGRATVALPVGLEPGRYDVTATYAGDAATSGSSSRTALSVVRARPRLTARLGRHTIRPKRRARLVVTATNPGATGGAAPTGSVLVRDRGRVIAVATLRASGRVTVRLPRLKKGAHRIRVSLAPGPLFESATARAGVLRVKARR